MNNYRRNLYQLTSPKRLSILLLMLLLSVNTFAGIDSLRKEPPPHPKPKSLKEIWTKINPFKKKKKDSSGTDNHNEVKPPAPEPAPPPKPTPVDPPKPAPKHKSTGTAKKKTKPKTPVTDTKKATKPTVPLI